MVLGRKRKISQLQRLLSAVWPRKGFVRLFYYFGHRLGRMRASPYSIAMGLACGVAVSFTPLLGLHIGLAIVLAWIFRGSILAAVIGTMVGTPWTFPLIWIMTYRSGIYFLRLCGEEFTDSQAILPDGNTGIFETLNIMMNNLESLLFPMFIGCLPFVFGTGITTFILCYFTVSRYKQTMHKRRLKKLAQQEAL